MRIIVNSFSIRIYFSYCFVDPFEYFNKPLLHYQVFLFLSFSELPYFRLVLGLQLRQKDVKEQQNNASKVSNRQLAFRFGKSVVSRRFHHSRRLKSRLKLGLKGFYRQYSFYLSIIGIGPIFSCFSISFNIFLLMKLFFSKANMSQAPFCLATLH